MRVARKYRHFLFRFSFLILLDALLVCLILLCVQGVSAMSLVTSIASVGLIIVTAIHLMLRNREWFVDWDFP